MIVMVNKDWLLHSITKLLFFFIKNWECLRKNSEMATLVMHDSVFCENNSSWYSKGTITTHREYVVSSIMTILNCKGVVKMDQRCLIRILKHNLFACHSNNLSVSIITFAKHGQITWLGKQTFLVMITNFSNPHSRFLHSFLNYMYHVTS